MSSYNESSLSLFFSQHPSSSASRASVCPTFNVHTEVRLCLSPSAVSVVWSPILFLLESCRGLLSGLATLTLYPLWSGFCRAAVDPEEMYQMMPLICSQLCHSFLLQQSKIPAHVLRAADQIFLGCSRFILGLRFLPLLWSASSSHTGFLITYHGWFLSLEYPCGYSPDIHMVNFFTSLKPLLTCHLLSETWPWSTIF